MMAMACCSPVARIGTGFPDMSLAEVLADPLIRAVMAADRVDPARLATELAETARSFGRIGNVPAKWSPVRRQEHSPDGDNVA
jgi:hypothetical protein